ncbi:MAG TPA: hypothetical protein VJ955_01985 [Desulfuromonadales bacterium]|nr:hypothetical protein [Desulfuromonadales bacterium]
MPRRRRDGGEHKADLPGNLLPGGYQRTRCFYDQCGYLEALGDEVILKNYLGETYAYRNAIARVEIETQNAVNDRY